MNQEGKVTREDVERVAMLARLGLSEEEKARFQREMNQVLEAFAALRQAPVEDVEPTARPVPLQNVLRADEVRPSLPREQVLANAPETSEGFFSVPRILEES